jgi:hypothetical protein
MIRPERSFSGSGAGSDERSLKYGSFSIFGIRKRDAFWCIPSIVVPI